jgi:hypothetical protein
VLAKGYKGRHTARVLLNMIDRFDEATGFTAMERSMGLNGKREPVAPPSQNEHPS